MKLKYKKMIILVSMCTMGIGLVTFSIVGPSSKEAANSKEVQIATLSDSNDELDNVGTDEDIQATDSEDIKVKSSDDAQAGSSSTDDIAGEKDSNTNRVAVAQEVDELKKNEYKTINKLIAKYLNAKLSKNIDKFKSIVNDTSLINIADIERQTNYIEEYNNIDVYTINGPEKGSLIAYAYYEVKFTSIDTLAPAMNAFYLKANEDGDYQVYLGDVEDETIEYIDKVNNSDEVLELIYGVNDKMKKAADADSALAEFKLKLEETANQVAQSN